MNEGVRRGGLVGPLILIGLGVLFLLANLGVLNWNFWQIAIRLWPLLLIAFGLDILFGRRSPWISLTIALVVLVIAGAAIWYLDPTGPGGQAVTTQQISQPLEGATRATVHISSGVGTLRIAGVPEPAPDTLVEGAVVAPEQVRLESDFSVNGDAASYRLRVREAGGSPFPATWGDDRGWDLRLNRHVPIDLRIDTGVGQASLDFSELNLTGLRISTGVGQTTLTLPASGQFRAQVSGGVGETIVQIPSRMAARIRIDGGLGDVNVDGSYVREDRVYTSPNYATAQDRVDIQVSGGVGRIAVRQIGP
jgi:hypothetical protein